MNEVAVITGGSGALGSAIAAGLIGRGIAVAIMSRDKDEAMRVASELRAAGGDSKAYAIDVLDRASMEVARNAVMEDWGRIDHLINCAGGNMPGATIMPDQSIDSLSIEDFDKVNELNLKGTLLPIIVFAEAMKKHGRGNIVNVSSMAASRPLTRVVGYAAAKAGVENLTKWLAVELATKNGDGWRVNAIAPGFFIGKQNRTLLLNEDDTLTQRGQTIIDHTPMRRFGKAEELCGVVNWLCSSDASFVTGAVIPIDGGFGAFSGV